MLKISITSPQTPCNRHRIMLRKLLAAALLSAAFFGVSCMSGIRPTAESAKASEIKGTFTAIFHGCNYANDPNTVVFLEKEGSRYEFEPYSPDYNYKIHKGLTSEEAVATAEKFFECNRSYRHSQIKKIIAPDGDLLGYEIKPIYQTFSYGTDDLLQTSYLIEDGKVIIRMWLNATRPMKIFDGGLDRGIFR